MVAPEDVKRYIADNLNCQFVEVSGDGHHFEAVIVSELFRGKSRVQRHQLVYRRSAIACARKSTPCRCRP